MAIKIYISLPKKYDKQDVLFERVPCQKNQKAIRVSKNPENLRIKKKQKEDPNQFFDWATPPAGDEPINVLDEAKPIILDDNPISVAMYMEEHPEVSFDEGEEENE